MKFYLLLINLGLIFNTCLGVQDKELKASTLTYLGIYATPVNPSVSNQLNLTANFYLNVERVESNSPAEKKGVQKFDLLMQFNDQVLINPEQLKCLVRSKKPGEEVILTILRKGKKEMITLTLGKINRTIERRFPPFR
jgi:serine protease Do